MTRRKLYQRAASRSGGGGGGSTLWQEKGVLTCSGTDSDNYFAVLYFPSRCSDFTGLSLFLCISWFASSTVQKRSVVRVCRGGRAGDTERRSPCKVEQTRIFRDGRRLSPPLAFIISPNTSAAPAEKVLFFVSALLQIVF